MIDIGFISNCPWCNTKGTPSFYEEYRYVLCPNCGSVGPRVNVRKEKGLDNVDCYKKAVELWNKRIDVKEQLDGMQKM